MPRRALFLITLILPPLVASPLHAQQMSEEVAALHRVLFAGGHNQVFHHPTESRELGLRYLDGNGVAPNELMGCALLFLSEGATRMTAGEDHPATDISERLFNERCAGRVSAKDQGFVDATCGTLGPQPQTFLLEPGSWAEIGPQGVAIDRPSGRTQHVLPNSCGLQYVFARHVAIVPETVDDPPTRHLIETLSWMRGGAEGRRNLQWMVFEIVESTFEVRVAEMLVQENGSLWPPPSIPEPFKDGATFTVTAKGLLRWRFDTDPPQSGTIERVP